MEICPISKKLAKVGSKLCQIQNKPLKLPNMVTLKMIILAITSPDGTF